LFLYFFLFWFILLLCQVGVHCGIFKIRIIYQIYHTWIHPLHHFPFPTFPLIPEIVSSGTIILFIYMCTHYLHQIHPPIPFPHLFPIPIGTNPTPGKTCSILLFSDFVKGKKWHLCLFKIATQGVSLWHFHVHMYYNSN
jgi:hypothetical protein